ncbi:colicin import membrane protein [Microvirga flocculans]|uniref:Colicin import membrane protein n=1 Tax=Microvirga flocculans TaxID=217168 RepID=A0A7W6IEG3_9HYPH|nr:TonB family protein [Microvirga flocculans]MBB4039656.1 colicin import membrane protein [Microvirga flocculans]
MKRSMFRAPVLALALGALGLGLAGCVTTADKRSDLVMIFMTQIKHCYLLPAAAIGGEGVTLEVRLNKDGSLEQSPKVLHGQADSAQAQAALNAVKRCTPFAIPQNIVSRYPQWKVMRIAFNTN